MNPIFLTVLVASSIALDYNPANYYLVPMDEILNTKTLFTGMPYYLVHKEDSNEMYLTWMPNDLLFAGLDQPADLRSTFYFVFNSWGQYTLYSGATGAESIITKCFGRPATCVLTLHDKIPREYPDATSWQLTFPFIAVDAEIGNYTISNPDSFGRESYYKVTQATLASLSFAFRPIAELVGEIVSINVTTSPREIVPNFLGEKKKKWRETVINPTAMSQEKTITESFTYTTKHAMQFKELSGSKRLGGINNENEIKSVPAKPVQEIITTNINTAGIDSTSDNGNGNGDTKEETRSADVEEKITVPAFTCVEIFLLTDIGIRKEQDFTANVRVSARGMRFSNNGVPLARQWLPGNRIPQLMLDLNYSSGTLMEVRAYDAIYLDDGMIVTEDGVNSQFIVQEIMC